MNQGESGNTVVSLDGSSIEKHQMIDSRQISNSYYPPEQHVEPTVRNTQDMQNVASQNPTSSSGATSMVPDYSGYAAYPNTDPYGYSSTGTAAYYNQYQQPPNQYQEPPNQYQQLPTQYQQPPTQYQQPPTQYQQPPDQYQLSSNQYQLPSTQYQQPPTQYQQPSTEYQQPATQYQQPSTEYQQPSTQYQQPSTQYQQQSTQYQKPPTQYQQPSTSQSYPHHLGAYQNTGAPHNQPLSSFQNTGSSAGPTSYSSTYLGAGDYQTSGSYATATYGTQTSSWNGGQYATYNSHQYSNYTPDSTAAYNSSNEQYYKQWEEYYKQTQTEVSCAPGTENISVPNASSVSCNVPNGSNVQAVPNNQMPGNYTPSWRPVEPSSVQPLATSSIQNGLSNPAQPHIQKLPEAIPTYSSFQSQQNPTFSQGTTSSYTSSYQVSQSYPSSFQTVSQPPEQIDLHKGNKMQIPTNPRIASTLPLGPHKADKDSYMTTSSMKPAYISVSMQTPTQVTTHNDTKSTLKPDTFPNSLIGYVERVLARCKNDRQKEASQEVLKKVIREATDDGTLHTKNWDTELLFPMPNVDAFNFKDEVEFPVLTSAMPSKRSPGRRTKSRWEPVPNANVVNKTANNTTNGAANYGAWNKQQPGKNSDIKASFGTKFSLPDQKRYNKNVGNVNRPTKRQRLGSDMNAADYSEASSDSDKERSLTKYYSAAITLTDSPEEKMRRENRSKRFDKGHGNRTKNNISRIKEVLPGNSYAKRAITSVLNKTFDESGSKAVEDIDWDALIVKGTCQEIEKRYLRLTSAPDPATVRPEEVLEKALLMVQTSQKNYLYKCDQLKSIRQDLTVQHIHNELTVKVYETHARLAIEAGDLSEYNQCQSQLKILYAEGIKGCLMEFAAYNLLCVILHSNNSRDLVSAMSRLSADAKRDEAVKHALSVRTAVTSGNYVMFFRLYKTAPNLSTFLMDLYVEKMRYAAVKCICRSYRPSVPVTYISQILGFGSALTKASDENEMNVVAECVEWLKAHGASLTSDNSEEILLDTKTSVSSLFMPEPEDAVSHGDANLAVNDFLTRSLVQ